MPVKWSADMDQLLLLKLLETNQIKFDIDKLVTAWPADRGDPPTRRAIQEHLVTLRKKLFPKESKAPKTLVPRTPKKAQRASRTPATSPQKSRSAIKSEPDGGTPATVKRELKAVEIFTNVTPAMTIKGEDTNGAAFVHQLNSAASAPQDGFSHTTGMNDEAIMVRANAEGFGEGSSFTSSAGGFGGNSFSSEPLRRTPRRTAVRQLSFNMKESPISSGTEFLFDDSETCEVEMADSDISSYDPDDEDWTV